MYPTSYYARLHAAQTARAASTSRLPRCSSALVLALASWAVVMMAAELLPGRGQRSLVQTGRLVLGDLNRRLRFSGSDGLDDDDLALDEEGDEAAAAAAGEDAERRSMRRRRRRRGEAQATATGAAELDSEGGEEEEEDTPAERRRRERRERRRANRRRRRAEAAAAAAAAAQPPSGVAVPEKGAAAPGGAAAALERAAAGAPFEEGAGHHDEHGTHEHSLDHPAPPLAAAHEGGAAHTHDESGAHAHSQELLKPPEGATAPALSALDAEAAAADAAAFPLGVPVGPFPPRDKAWVEEQRPPPADHPERTRSSHKFDEAKQRSMNPPRDRGGLPAKTRAELSSRLVVALGLGVHSGRVDVDSKGVRALPIVETMLKSFLPTAQPHHLYR